MEQENKDSFESLDLAPWITKQLKNLGLSKPSPIQKNCIPAILSGKDCVGIAKTGSGKTFAFALPILQKLAEEPTGHFALILTPTHELAYQISEQFSVAGKPMGCRVCVVVGGTDQLYESQKLQNRPHIIVAMPGRLADHLTGCDTFNFDTLKFVVIDEADRMLNGNFDESLEIIERCLPKKRQNLYFSATMQPFIKESKIFSLTMDNLVEWSEDVSVATVETLDQQYVLCAEYDRDMVLVEVVRNFREKSEDANIIIFTNTKKDCQLLSITLNSVGFENVCLHGYMKQRERVAALTNFKSNIVRILIATDVASRGLDIPSVQLVLNHRLPKLSNEYIHRVGRTARAGRRGLAISIFRFPRDLEFLCEIETAINTKLTEYKIDQRMVERIFMQVSVSKREAEVKLDNKDFDERKRNYRRKKWLENDLDPDEMEAKWKQEQKEKYRKIKEERRLAKEKKVNEIEKLKDDDRFKDVTVKVKVKKPKQQKQEDNNQGINKKNIIIKKKQKIVIKRKNKTGG